MKTLDLGNLEENCIARRLLFLMELYVIFYLGSNSQMLCLGKFPGNTRKAVIPKTAVFQLCLFYIKKAYRQRISVVNVKEMVQ